MVITAIKETAYSNLLNRMFLMSAGKVGWHPTAEDMLLINRELYNAVWKRMERDGLVTNTSPKSDLYTCKLTSQGQEVLDKLTKELKNGD